MYTQSLQPVSRNGEWGKQLGGALVKNRDLTQRVRRKT